MCRLAVFGGMEDAVDLACAFTQLECSMGGHGNGLLLCASGDVMKGVNLPVSKLAREAAGVEGFGVFHTRVRSAGNVCDKLCHPFEVDGEAGRFVVAHNGTWGKWGAYASEGEESDTEAMATLVGDYGVGVLLSDAANWSGMWIAYDIAAQELYGVRRSGTFSLQPLEPYEDGRAPFFHASEDIDDFKDWRKLSADLKQDILYEFQLNGKAWTRPSVKAVEPEVRVEIPDPPKKTYTYGSSGAGKNGNYPFWSNNGTWCHSAMFDLNGERKTCFCKPHEVRTGKYCYQACAPFIALMGFEPFYTDEGATPEAAVEAYKAKVLAQGLTLEDYADLVEEEDWDRKYGDDVETVLAAQEALSDRELDAIEAGKRGKWPCMMYDCDDRTEEFYCDRHAYLTHYSGGLVPDVIHQLPPGVEPAQPETVREIIEKAAE